MNSWKVLVSIQIMVRFLSSVKTFFILTWTQYRKLKQAIIITGKKKKSTHGERRRSSSSLRCGRQLSKKLTGIKQILKCWHFMFWEDEWEDVSRREDKEAAAAAVYKGAWCCKKKSSPALACSAWTGAPMTTENISRSGEWLNVCSLL